MWDTIAKSISEATGEPFTPDNRRSVSGGCINQGSAVSDGQRTFFVKFNQASRLDMFEAEAVGLQQMADTQTIRVPRPICTGVADASAYIVLEWLDIGGSKTSVAEKMGRQLAQMHRKGTRDRFGFDCDNTIGSTPQPNPWTADWGEFFAQHRIQFQLDLARRNGGSFEGCDRLVDRIPELLAGYNPQPSLLHGDLWGGNASATRDGEPVLFDPAAYYGDREADIAMTELFGGFGSAFYRAYNDEWPLDAGYERRKPLYNLYHILNHFNIFGGGYASQAQRLIRQVLA